jgi:Ca2+-binding RTX toxin-like protein
MQKVRSFVSAYAIGEAMNTLVMDGNFAALDAVTDYLTAAQKSGIPVNDIDNVLTRIADFTYAAPGTDSDDIAANALRDFMGKLGAYANKFAVSSAVDGLLRDSNLEGAAAVLDNVSDETALYAQSTTQPLLNLYNAKILNSAGDFHLGTNADEVVFARGGNDVIRGGNGNDELYGGNGTDILFGDAGNDVLSGGAGKDYLLGSNGADRFVFESPSTGLDTVYDFRADQGDELDFSSLLTGFDPVTQAITDFVTEATVNGSTTISVDVDGTGAGAAVAVVTLQNVADIDIQAQFNQGQIIA